MKNLSTLRLLCLVLGLAAAAHAQQMPQDNWRYDGVEFSGPDANKALRSIAIGTGGVYVGYGDPATTIVQFQEDGTFIRQFGTFGYILGIACDSNGNVYVLDRDDSKVKAFDKDGNPLREWGGPGSADGQFSLDQAAGWRNCTTMIAADKNNQIYVCDLGNSRVQVFDVNGNFLRKWGQLGNLPSQFTEGNPGAITCSENGDVYVGSTGNGNTLTQVFAPDGSYKRQCDSGSQVWYFFDSFCLAPDDILLIENGGSFVARDGRLINIRSFTIPGNPSGLATNKKGDLYAALANTVRIYEREYSSVNNSLTPPGIPQPLVLGAAQRTGTTWLDVDYKVTDADSATVSTGALAFLNGGNLLTDAVAMRTFREGTAANIGQNMPANTTKRITWDMAADWSVDFSQIQVEVLAKDDRNLMGAHWITVPASGSNPAIQVSAWPISDAELLNLWYWLVATNKSDISLSSGTITGTADPYNGVALATTQAVNWWDPVTSTTTAAGRQYLYGLMGVRLITADEITQAQAGNYGFSSVDTNSVVKVP